MRSKKVRAAVYGIAALILVCTAAVYGRLPEKIPTHWGIDGVTTYGGRANIWVLAGMGPVFAVMFDLLPKVDPKKKNYEKFGRYYDGFCVLMELFAAAVWALVLSESLAPGRIQVGKTVTVLVGLLFLVLGNYMPKIKPNFYMGIRTPWTISSENVWRRTHRLGGKLFAAAGAVSVLSGLFLPGRASAFLLGILVVAVSLGAGVMSYVWWRQENRS